MNSHFKEAPHQEAPVLVEEEENGQNLFEHSSLSLLEEGEQEVPRASSIQEHPHQQDLVQEEDEVHMSPSLMEEGRREQEEPSASSIQEHPHLQDLLEEGGREQEELRAISIQEHLHLQDLLEEGGREQEVSRANSIREHPHQQDLVQEEDEVYMSPSLMEEGRREQEEPRASSIQEHPHLQDLLEEGGREQEVPRASSIRENLHLQNLVHEEEGHMSPSLLEEGVREQEVPRGQFGQDGQVMQVNQQLSEPREKIRPTGSKREQEGEKESMEESGQGFESLNFRDLDLLGLLRGRRAPPSGNSACVIKRVGTVMKTPGSYNLEDSVDTSKRKVRIEEENESSIEEVFEEKDETSVVNSEGEGLTNPVKGKKRKKVAMAEEKESNMQRAIEARKEENLSIAAAAERFGIPRTTLSNRLNGTYKNIGRGRRSSVFTDNEEKEIADAVDVRQGLGAGLDYPQLASFLQECLKELLEANPGRSSKFEDTDQLPNYDFCWRFVRRNNLVLRTTSELSKTRELLTEAEVRGWQELTYQNLVKENPEIWDDPRRLFNEDETSFELSGGKVKVLAKRGTKNVGRRSSGSRDHTTLILTVSASGGLVPPRFVLKGIRDVSHRHLGDLEPGEKTGAMKFSYSPSGFNNQGIQMKVLQDLADYGNSKKIKFPIVLLLDGALCHINKSLVELAKELQILLWLFYPGATPFLQPLDVGVICHFKRKLRQVMWGWHCKLENMGRWLNQYTAVPLISKTLNSLPLEQYSREAFRDAGIMPWNPMAVKSSAFKPATKFAALGSYSHKVPEGEVQEGGEMEVEGLEGGEGEVEVCQEQELKNNRSSGLLNESQEEQGHNKESTLTLEQLFEQEAGAGLEDEESSDVNIPEDLKEMINLEFFNSLAPNFKMQVTAELRQQKERVAMLQVYK